MKGIIDGKALLIYSASFNLTADEFTKYIKERLEEVYQRGYEAGHAQGFADCYYEEHPEEEELDDLRSSYGGGMPR